MSEGKMCFEKILLFLWGLNMHWQKQLVGKRYEHREEDAHA